MIAIDTNVLLRFLLNDDREQASKAKAIMERNEVFIAKTVFLEAEWVLRYSYQYLRARICEALSQVLLIETVTVEDRWVVQTALDLHKRGLDFADALHYASGAKSGYSFSTFDKALIQGVAGLELPFPASSP